ncbi:MAG TPA: ABC transporter permease [Mycobacteriales bacterium]|jgi:D-xylose transport system permease protein|nr:ABC transporter permease [Mycobacteriales bacterium]
MATSTSDIESPDATLPATDDGLLGGNELVANSLGEYVGATIKRIRNGDSGVLPVVVGLIIIVIIFQTQNSKFLSTGNLTNLIEQSGVFVILGMAEVFVLLLGEIDLSTGFVGAVGAVITAELATPPHNVNWALAVLAGLASCAVIGLIQGLLITRLGLPSFVVTLAGLLGWNGFLLYLIQRDKAATGGTIAVTSNVLNDIVNGSMTTTAGWILMVVLVVIFAVMTLLQNWRRRSSGLVTAPLSLTLIKIVAVAAAGVILVLVCNADRGFNDTKLDGVPWIVPLVMAVLVIYSLLLGRMRFGRYLYAIGGNAEAARRAGISLNSIRLLAFVLCSFTAGIAGIVYLSQLGSISSDVEGGNLVLYAIASAVIGGTSLFGGRGKMIHAVLGGIVITTIYNGMGLIQIGAAGQQMVIALVLLAAVIVDAVARRGATTR